MSPVNEDFVRIDLEDAKLKLNEVFQSLGVKNIDDL